MITPGQDAPDFELTTNDGSRVRLSALRGKPVILFFYPRADTPGCTTEACEFRDNRTLFDDLDAVLLGISPDPVSSVTRFGEKLGVNYQLLADTDHEVAMAYGVWKAKRLFGNHLMGVERTTFLINRNGQVSRVFEKVKPQGHALAVARALESSLSAS
ncbi:MAG: thioredoxin-dependent thiol peroxidase [Gemmatimonadota bacterium]|nr:thioredoxin-dependent thiol peroxidase [Gemmatimonadota bacterium]